MKLMTLSGSIRAKSSNTAALAALRLIAPADIEVVECGLLAQLPPFNPDQDGAPPPPVLSLRSLVGTCDGLIISSPEYAHGIAGSLKNLLDWLVGSESFAGIHVAIVNASPRAHHAQDQLREILSTMAARVVEEACVDLPLLGRGLDADGIAGDIELAGRLRYLLEQLKVSIETEAERSTAFA